MNTDRTCGCKGFNSCLICEAEFGIESSDPAQERIDQFGEEREFCIDCSRLFNKINDENVHSCEKTSEEPVFQGIKIIRDFVTLDEEKTLLEDLDEAPWTTSQSGRRKQNYGPRANFKKRKAKLGAFQGFPMPTKFIQERFKTLSSIQVIDSIIYSFISTKKTSKRDSCQMIKVIFIYCRVKFVFFSSHCIESFGLFCVFSQICYFCVLLSNYSYH